MKIKSVFVAVCLAMTVVVGRAEPLAVTVQEPWSNLFAGKEAVFHATVDGGPFEGRVAWQFSADGRTLARGERAVRTAAGGRETVEIRLAVPEVNPGVIMATKLTVSSFASGIAKEAGSVERTIWVFPPDPFTGRVEWLKKLEIHLFDPVGATAKLFDEMKVPYATVRNMDALCEPKDGVLVIGEGVSFRDYRGLGDSLVKAAAAGWPILCLAPTSGELTLPVTGNPDLPEPKSVTLRRQDIITQLDKRLDACRWKTDGKIAGRGLKLRGDRGPVAAEVVNQPGAWPWMEMTFDKDRGRLVVCGFGIVDGWAESPTPRFLLVKVLEHVSGSKIRE